ncbi:hypothetical protein FNAPI_9290 [Fusarium napiforme]|uniref:Uncharacterized protein n=1 Tax=Fusarium napiforme TaxID=42672 RepID=A0A8H5MWD9_9HYPO|nr:hypothetical protein FNAPI_9290 [Fusarium napiforme]
MDNGNKSIAYDLLRHHNLLRHGSSMKPDTSPIRRAAHEKAKTWSERHREKNLHVSDRCSLFLSQIEDNIQNQRRKKQPSDLRAYLYSQEAASYLQEHASALTELEVLAACHPDNLSDVARDDMESRFEDMNNYLAGGHG